jgi:hypothetical protein
MFENHNNNNNNTNINNNNNNNNNWHHDSCFSMIEHKVNFCIRCSLVGPPKQLKIVSKLLSKEPQRNLDLNSVDLMETSGTTNVVLPEDYTDLFCS